MSSEDKKASHAGLPLPYNIIAGDMNAALYTNSWEHKSIHAAFRTTVHGHAQQWIRCMMHRKAHLFNQCL